MQRGFCFVARTVFECNMQRTRDDQFCGEITFSRTTAHSRWKHLRVQLTDRSELRTPTAWTQFVEQILIKPRQTNFQCKSESIFKIIFVIEVPVQSAKKAELSPPSIKYRKSYYFNYNSAKGQRTLNEKASYFKCNGY